jgi:hypothetical protein
MGYYKNLAIEKGYFDETDDEYRDSFDCQIQAEEFQYRQSISPQPESNKHIELIPF